jgi:energy-coupling factor transport system permease protein
VAAFSPKIKIVLYILLAVLIFATSSLKIDIFLLSIVMVFAIKVKLSVLKRGLIPISLFLFFTFISNALFYEGEIVYEILGLSLTYEGLSRGGELTLKLFILIFGAKVLTATTKAEDLIAGMNELLGPLGKIGFVKDLMYTISITFRLLPIVYEEALDLYRNIRKSDEPGLKSKIKLSVELLTTLFERSLSRAKEMSEKEEKIGS